MDFITILLIAIGLSFDTFAVSVSTGISIYAIKFHQAMKVAFILSFFQSLMPFMGWFIGKQVQHLISNYDHWVAFGLLFLLGLKMIYDSFKNESGRKLINLTFLIGMALATSIDALVVGISFAFMDTNIYWSILIIGVVTFLVSMTGIFCGKEVGGKLGKRMEILGGLILIGIGFKILISHLM